MLRRNMNFAEAQWEWIRRQAYERNITYAEVVRQLVVKAMEEGAQGERRGANSPDQDAVPEGR